MKHQNIAEWRPLIPLVASLAHSQSPHTDWLVTAAVFAVGLSNGLLATVAMMRGPQLFETTGDRRTAAAVMTAAMFGGIACGSARRAGLGALRRPYPSVPLPTDPAGEGGEAAPPLEGVARRSIFVCLCGVSLVIHPPLAGHYPRRHFPSRHYTRVLFRFALHMIILGLPLFEPKTPER